MSITYTCSLFGYNRQVYYRAKARLERRVRVAEQVVGLVQSIRKKMPRIGGRKLYHLLELSLRKLKVGRDRLFDILRANHLLIKPKRSYHKTTNSHHRFKKHKNLIEHIVPNRPEQIWVSDITYIGTRENPQYLALVTDAYSKKIIGHDVSDSLSAQGSIRALELAVKNRTYKSKMLIHHSDRGLQYCSDDYQEILNQNDIKCSMTEQYDPYQNAVAERVNGILKQEFLLGMKIKDLALMKCLIKASIKIYNNERPHLSCHLKTPEFMHQQSKIEIKTYKRKRAED